MHEGQYMVRAAQRGAATGSVMGRMRSMAFLARGAVARVRHAAASRAASVTTARLTRSAAAVAFLLVLGACVHGDYVTGGRWEDDRLVGTWKRSDLVHDAWYGQAVLETTWQFRSNGRVHYSEVLRDHGGRWLEETRASGRWYSERHGNRVTIDYYSPSSWGTESLRYEAYGHTLYLDGLRYERW